MQAPSVISARGYNRRLPPIRPPFPCLLLLVRRITERSGRSTTEISPRHRRRPADGHCAAHRRQMTKDTVEFDPMWSWHPGSIEGGVPNA